MDSFADAASAEERRESLSNFRLLGSDPLRGIGIGLAQTLRPVVCGNVPNCRENVLRPSALESELTDRTVACRSRDLKTLRFLRGAVALYSATSTASCQVEAIATVHQKPR